MISKLPTIEDCRNYDGAHCFKLWRSLPETWSCSGCCRSKFELLRWTRRRYKKGVGKCKPYYDWMAGLHMHHDHAPPDLDGNGRFPDTIICDQCNAADGTAKRCLGLPADFSFSPSEIHRFVHAIPHRSHTINLVEAQRLFAELAV